MAKFDLNRLREVSLNISEINVLCQVWQLRRLHRTGGLITFAGSYRPGSAGSDDAKFINWKVAEFCDLDLNIDGMVIDCRHLDYTWGDDFRLSPRQRGDAIPHLVVIQREQATAYGWLGVECLRFDLGQAIEETNERFRAMKPLL